MIEIKHVDKWYGPAFQALKDCTTRVDKGEAMRFVAGQAGIRTGLSACGAISSGFWPGGRRDTTVSVTGGGRSSTFRPEDSSKR